MRKTSLLLSAMVIMFCTGCKSLQKNLSTVVYDDGKLELVFVQVNDVYEIAPLANGTEGGMARVASVIDSCRQRNPNTFAVMAGDFLSPSVYNSLSYQNKRVRGRQMVEAMNSAGIAFSIFGNHEFDISETELQDRINELGFTWIASNAFHKTGNGEEPFGRNGSVVEPFGQTYMLNVSDLDGTKMKIGIIGLTLPFNKAAYVTYSDPLSTAKKLYNQLKDSVDAVIAITHQSMEDDELLAKEIPGLVMIMGGHEHDMRFKKVDDVYITKAHANGKSVFLNTIQLNKKDKHADVKPSLRYLDASVPIQPKTNEVVQKWTKIANDNYQTLGFDATEVVIKTGDPLDGRESSVRAHPTNLTRLVVKGLEYAVPEADVVMMNAGSIRIDDVLEAPVTQYDIIRMLPFGGGIKTLEMRGSLLKKILDIGRTNAGIGGYLLTSEKIAQQNGAWLIDNQEIKDVGVYKVGVTDFLTTGGEANLGFLKAGHPDILAIADDKGRSKLQADIRLALVAYLKTR